MVSSALVPIVAQGRIQTWSEFACMGIFFGMPHPLLGQFIHNKFRDIRACLFNYFIDVVLH